jgi:hypothetical protein
MGHLRLAKPPASRKWREIVAYVTAGDVDVAQLANAISRAAEKSLRRAADDAAFVEACWLLTKIPEAAKSKDFSKALRDIGISAPDHPSVIDIIVGFDAAIEKVLRATGAKVTDLSEMAKQAGISAFYSVAQERLPSLWETTSEDERTTLATLSSPDKFGDLAQRFFTNLIERNIQYYFDREWPKHIGPDKLVHSIGDTVIFDKAMRRHCEESTLIMRAFAQEWLGKNAYALKKDLSRRDVQGFAYIALQKIGNELAQRSS